MSSVASSRESYTVPLSPEQRAIWVTSDVGGSSLTSNRSWLFVAKVEGELIERRWFEAAAQVADRHEVLRHAFVVDSMERTVRQQPLDGSRTAMWDCSDLRSSDAPEAAVATRLQALRTQPFDLAHGESLRIMVARVGDAEWVVALSAPAVLLDRRSLAMVFSAIVDAYGRIDRDPEAPFQYCQYVDWREELAEENEAREAAAYWQRYVPADIPMSPRLSYRTAIPLADRCHGQVSRVIDRGPAEIDEAMYQAAWWALLARITGCYRFVGGWQHDCRRDYAPLRHAIGVFEKTLPVVIDIATQEPLATLAARLAHTLENHIAVQEAWCAQAHSLGNRCSIGFEFVSAVPIANAGGLRWRLVEQGGSALSFELAMQVMSEPGGTKVSVLWDPAHYNEAAAATLLDQYVLLLSAGLEQPSAPIADFSPRRGGEPIALTAPSGTMVEFDSSSTGERIARWAASTPTAAAIEFEQRVLTYAELHQRVDRLGAWLRDAGVGAGELVALELDRSAELVIAMLAAWRIGAAFLPLDPSWPVARRQLILADAKPALHLDAAHLAEANVAASTETIVDRAAPLDHLAYVLYTSGSTGAPKGVMVEHRQLANYVSAVSTALRLEDSRRWGFIGSVAADLGYTALFGALANGACLVIAGAAEAQDAESFSRFVRDRRIDALKIVPSHLDALLDSGQPALPARLILGGEATSRALLGRIQKIAPACQVFNHYGPTETTVGIMVHKVDNDTNSYDVLPLTEVLPNCRIYVLDHRLRPVQVGELGEVYVGGVQVCRGYLHGRHAEAFLPDPFVRGERLYRTGDLAHLLPGGGLRLAGRADQQVKVHGFRMEPAEIEAVMLRLNEVRQAVVVARRNDHADCELIAFVVLNDAVESATARRRLRETMDSTVPAPMRPSTYVFVDSVPRLANGKIDRLAVSDMPVTEPEVPAVAGPRDAVESAIVKCMATLLKRDAVGVNDDFFDLGGHSLLVIKLVASIRKQLGIEMPPASVFDHSTPSALALAVRSVSDDADQLELRAAGFAMEQPA